MDQRIQIAIALMESNINRPLSLATLARMTGLSASRFRHKFKAEIGVTPTIYLQNIRLEMARTLLASNSLSVKEVKAAIGIQSDSYFTHRFKKAYGQTPSGLRSTSNSEPETPELDQPITSRSK